MARWRDVAQRTHEKCPYLLGFFDRPVQCGAGHSEMSIFTFVKIRKDPEARRAVLLLISRGMVTVPEAAQLAGVSRQLVRAWCKSRRMSVDRARKARIAKLWRSAMSYPGA